MLFSWVNAETKQVSFLLQEKLANEVINPYFTALREGNVNDAINNEAPRRKRTGSYKKEYSVSVIFAITEIAVTNL
jgi:hypothetical protein